jgi:hypothetical protein
VVRILKALLRKSPFTHAGFVSLEITYISVGITVDSSTVAASLRADSKTSFPFLA